MIANQINKGCIMTDELKFLVKDSPISVLSECALKLLWRDFSDFFCAGYLIYNEIYINRFIKWVISGNDEDVWS